MGVINIKNAKVSGNGQLLSNATVATPNAICIDGLSVEGHAKVLQDLNILDFCKTAEARANEMSPEEYESFRKLLQKLCRILQRKKNTSVHFFRFQKQ